MCNNNSGPHGSVGDCGKASRQGAHSVHKRSESARRHTADSSSGKDGRFSTCSLGFNSRIRLEAVDARIVKRVTPLNNAHHSRTVIVGAEGGLDWLQGLPDLPKLVLSLLSVGEARGKYENGQEVWRKQTHLDTKRHIVGKNSPTTSFYCRVRIAVDCTALVMQYRKVTGVQIPHSAFSGAIVKWLSRLVFSQ